MHLYVIIYIQPIIYCIFSLVPGTVGSSPTILILIIAIFLYLLLEAISIKKNNYGIIGLLLSNLENFVYDAIKWSVPGLS